jgi:hypothetical protein
MSADESPLLSAIGRHELFKRKSCRLGWKKRAFEPVPRWVSGSNSRHLDVHGFRAIALALFSSARNLADQPSPFPYARSMVANEMRQEINCFTLFASRLPAV